MNEMEEKQMLGESGINPTSNNSAFVKKKSARAKRIRKKLFKFKRWLITFLIGLFAGIFLMLVQPWRMISNRTSEEKTAAAIGDAEDSIVIKDEANEAKAVVTIDYLENKVKDASDLITTRYWYKDANTYANTKKFFDVELPFTTNEVVYTYEGTISLGIDVSGIGFSVDNAQKEIQVRLPDVKIIANEIDADSFEFITAKSSIFNDVKMEDYTSLIAELKKEKASKIMSDDAIMEEVRKRSESVIRDLIQSTDLAADYEIQFD